MGKTKGFKIFICLILTLIAAVLWVYVQASMTSDVGRTKYEGAVFVEISGEGPGQEEAVLWKM